MYVNNNETCNTWLFSQPNKQGKRRTEGQKSRHKLFEAKIRDKALQGRQCCQQNTEQYILILHMYFKPEIMIMIVVVTDVDVGDILI